MAKANARPGQSEPAGLWHQPALMHLLADVLIVLAAAALAWAALTLIQRLPLFLLRELVLDAPPHRVSLAQLEHVARSALSGNFFMIDLDAARAEIEKLPWVRKAVVKRRWPDGIVLSIEEYEVGARWRPLGAAGQDALVSVQGEVFRADLPEHAERLPIFSGPEGSAPEMLRRHAEFEQALAGIDRRVVGVTLSARRAWRLRLDDGTLIELGRDRERHPLSERIERFAAHYAETRRQLGEFRIADMRYPNGFAVSNPRPLTKRDENS